MTDIHLIQYLLSENADKHEDKKVKVQIRTKQKCPVCDGLFSHIKKIGFICPEHKTMPTRFFVDVSHEGQRIKIYSDKSGRVIGSYQIALETHDHVKFEIVNHQFDPSRYVASDLKRFQAVNMLEGFLIHKMSSIAPSYQKDYKRMADIVKEFFQVKDVRDIRKLDIINFKAHLEKNFTLKGKSVKNIMDFLKTFMRYLKNEIEVIDTVPSFPEVDVTPHSFKWLSQEDQIRLFDFIAEGDKPIIAFLMLHGCRPGEARALKCKDVDLRTQALTISSTFSREVYRSQRKGRRARSVTIPIHPEIAGYVMERVRSNLPEAFLFVNPRTGQHYTQDSLNRLWDNVRVKAGISRELRLYDATRHSFASQLVNSGTSIFKVSKLLGHSSVKMTEKYAHSDIENLKTDMAKLSLKPVKDVVKTVPRLSPKK